jgi:glyoxylase-like metal-dependent hydrolase (beta-lactamase superfamily II)
MRAIDVRHVGRERVICCFEHDGLLIDPGPESCLETLLAALGGERPRAVLLTHIHLDHAGASGALVERFPGLEVYVHERGAPHMADPERLLASAARLYGDDMDRLWGRVLPVPEASLRVLRGGEQVHGLDVAYAPGHASHHVVYHDVAAGVVLAGDVAGVRIPPSALVVPPTPPPDIDLERWLESLALVRGWRPKALALTHFGLVEDVEPHLDALQRELERLAADGGAGGREAFLDDLDRRVRPASDDTDVHAAYAQAAPPEQLWLGLERAWRKRAERGT